MLDNTTLGEMLLSKEIQKMLDNSMGKFILKNTREPDGIYEFSFCIFLTESDDGFKKYVTMDATRFEKDKKVCFWS